MFPNFAKLLLGNEKVTRMESLSLQCKGQTRKRQTPRVGPNHRLALETLEDRCVPAQIAWVPDELLVSFRPGTAATAKESAHAQVNGKVGETITTAAMRHDGSPAIERVRLGGMSVEQAMAVLAKNPNVLFAEPNYVYTTTAVSNDLYYTNGSLWGMYGDTSIAGGPVNQYGSAANQAWNAGYTGSKTVYVGIIDEGYQYTHPELAENAGINPGEVPGDNKDNDGNGYVDDVYGWDFVHNDNTIYDSNENTHGTHVAGTIAAKGGNDQGVAGVNWSVSLLSAKFLGPSGGTTANAIKAVDYFTNLKVNGNVNIVATNNSWGGGGYSQALQDAITRAAKANILFIAAAGNATSNNDNTPVYPCSYSSLTGSSTESAATYENVISVAAIDSTGNLASFSNYGKISVDIGAPGVGIVSTVPLNSYGSSSGTSMAAPHVTGTAALYASAYPGATASQIREAILIGSTQTDSLLTKTSSGGRLNAWSTLGVPPPITFPKVSLGDVILVENNSGTAMWQFTATLSLPAPSDGISVHWDTADGTATLANNDYIASSGTLVFNKGETSKSIAVGVVGDINYEPNELFYINLTQPLGLVILDAQGIGTILNDDAAVIPAISVSDSSIREGNNNTRIMKFPVVMTNIIADDVSIYWATSSGTASGSSDYIQTSGILVIPKGTTTGTISVITNGDKTAENDEIFYLKILSISNSSFATIFDSVAIGTIINDDRGQAINEGPFDKMVDNLFVPDSLVISLLLEQTGPGKPKG